jgi:hypothetical protein
MVNNWLIQNSFNDFSGVEGHRNGPITHLNCREASVLSKIEFLQFFKHINGEERDRPLTPEPYPFRV